jgi:O-antigen ligase
VDSVVKRARPIAIERALPGFAPANLAPWLLGFALVGYLAFDGGGYDPVVRGQVGIALWWIVLLGAATGVLGLRWGRLGWTAVGLLAGYTVLTAVALSWSESAERTVAELGRTTTHLAVLVLALSAVAGRSPRALLNGLTCAVGAVAVLSALSRLQPEWFPVNDQIALLGEAAHRLSYPLNYWNGLGAFMAMAVPLLLACAVSARSRAAQGLAAAVIPFAALTLYFTASRGGVIALLLAVIAFLALAHDRLAVLPAILIGAATSAIVVSAATQRAVLDDGLPTAAAKAAGEDVLVLALVAAAGAALLQVAAGLVARHAGRPAWTQVPPRRAAIGTVAIVAVVVAGALATGLAGQVQDSWLEFKTPAGALGDRDPGQAAANVFDRLGTASGNGRWQVWMSAVDAMQTDPLRGLGPGTFEFWWARNATIPSFLRDAHSLVFETMAELGIPGLLLLGGLLLMLLVAGAVRARTADPQARTQLAAATAALVAFVVSASIDWSWELFVLPAAALILGAVAISASRSDWEHEAPAPPSVPRRAGVAVFAAVALVAVAVPLAGSSAVRASQADVAAGRLPEALAEARTAERTQPYAATPRLQRALVLESAGDTEGALAAARRAADGEPTNWRTWLVLSRLQALTGDATGSVTSFRRARALNPRSPLLRK